MYLKKKTPGHINATSLIKIKLGRILSSLVKIEPKMPSDSNFYNLFVLPISLIGMHKIYPAFQHELARAGLTRRAITVICSNY